MQLIYKCPYVHSDLLHSKVGSCRQLYHPPQSRYLYHIDTQCKVDLKKSQGSIRLLNYM